MFRHNKRVSFAKNALMKRVIKHNDSVTRVDRVRGQVGSLEHVLSAVTSQGRVEQSGGA